MPKSIKVFLILILLSISIEFAWNKINEELLIDPLSDKKISLMSYNLFFKNKDRDASIKVIKDCNPDILIVQELTLDWANNLNKSIGSQYPYKKIVALKGTHGIGVYSKFKIVADELLFNDSELPFAQITEITIGGKNVQIINAHTASPAAAVEHLENFISLFHSNYILREKQFEAINTATKAKGILFDVQILAGDLNTTQYEPLYRDLKSTWVDLFNEVGEGSSASFPHSGKSNPLLTLDYIFVRGKTRPINMRVIKGGSSDHLAIKGEIYI